MDWNTYYNFPVSYKKWLIERIQKEIERNNGQSKGAQHNDSETRLLQGRHRGETPAKLRRFT
jgi:hypothetical protein